MHSRCDAGDSDEIASRPAQAEVAECGRRSSREENRRWLHCVRDVVERVRACDRQVACATLINGAVERGPTANEGFSRGGSHGYRASAGACGCGKVGWHSVIECRGGRRRACQRAAIKRKVLGAGGGCVRRAGRQGFSV